jgi:hypothetical protein
MSKRKSKTSNIIQFPPEASLAYYERQIEQENDFMFPLSFLYDRLYLAQWFENPQNKAAGFRAMTKWMEWPPSVANEVLDSLEKVGYAGFPKCIPIPEELLEDWRAIVKGVLEMPLRQRAILEVLVDRPHAGETERTITHDMITAKYNELKSAVTDVPEARAGHGHVRFSLWFFPPARR